MAPRRCIACDQREPFPVLFERFGFTLVRCACGLVFQHPQPSERELAGTYYQDENFARALLAELRPVTLESARRKLTLLGATSALSPGLRVLDVGASSGAWLEVAAGAGLRATGVELGEATAAMARERGLDVRTGTLEQALPGLEEERFDLITFWDVLEHLPDPRQELSQARALLTRGGKLAMTCPNVEGLFPRLTYRLLARRTGIWEHPELPVHLYEFSPSTMRRLLERCGYRAERVTTYGIPYSHYASTSLASARLGGGWRARALRGAFGALHTVAYPIARVTGQGNGMFVLAEPGRGSARIGGSGAGQEG